MNFDETRMGYAFASTAGVFYVACSVLYALSPEFYAQIFGSAFHVVQVSPKPFELATTALGFLVTMVVAFALGHFFAATFNYFKPLKQ